MRLLEAKEQADRICAAYDEPVPQVNFFERVRARQRPTEQGFRHNTGLRGQLSGMPWGDAYMAQVQEWAAHLEWPPLPAHPGKDVGVSLLELAIHFSLWARRFPVIRVITRTGGSHYCSDPESLQLVHVSADDLSQNPGHARGGASEAEMTPHPSCQDVRHGAFTTSSAFAAAAWIHGLSRLAGNTQLCFHSFLGLPRRAQPFPVGPFVELSRQCSARAAGEAR